MGDAIGRQLDYILRQEERYLKKARRAFFKAAFAPITGKLEEKIPSGLKATLEKAFYGGFKLVFERGGSLIERSYDRERLELEHAVNDALLDTAPSVKRAGTPGRWAAQGRMARTAAATAEGGILGLLGIGLPDIPIFIGVLLSGICETCLACGFDCDTPAERRYMLELIAVSLAPGRELLEADRRLDTLGRAMGEGCPPPTREEMDGAMARAAQAMAGDMLYAKFVQGLPIVGVVGGAFNFSYCRKITGYAGLKYQKRYLLGKLR